MVVVFLNTHTHAHTHIHTHTRTHTQQTHTHTSSSTLHFQKFVGQYNWMSCKLCYRSGNNCYALAFMASGVSHCCSSSLRYRSCCCCCLPERVEPGMFIRQGEICLLKMLAPERNASVPPSPHTLFYNCFVAILNLNSLPTLFSEIFIFPPWMYFLIKIPELELNLAPDVISGAALSARPFMVIRIPLLK